MELDNGDTICVPKIVGKYEIHHQIGIGSTSVVALAINLKTQRKYAIKIVNRNFMIEQGLFLRFEQEIRIMKSFDHPHIVKTEEILFDKNYIYVVMEYCFNGDLFDYIKTASPLPEGECLKIFEQTLQALSYLHHKKIAHRDIKPENILFDKNFNIKLIDFGFSRTFDNNIFFESICGSPAYVAPEIVTGKKYNATADIWSLGVVLYAMVVGQLPFEGDDIKEQLKKVAYSQPVYPTKLSHALIDLLTRLLEKDPMRRISLGKIKIHPWINGFEEVDQIFSSFKPTAEKVEKDVIYQMNLLGIGTNDIEQQIVLNQINNQTISYKLLQRTKQMRSLCRTPTKAVINYRESKHLTPLIRTRNLPTRNPDSTRNRNLNKIQSKNRENDPTVANIDKGKIPSIIASTNKPIKSPQKSFNKTPFFQKKKMIQDNTFTPRFSRF